MKKIHLIDTIKDFLLSDNAGDMKGVYHEEIIKVHLNDAFNQAIYAAWLNGKKFSEYSQLDAWSKTYEADVVQAATTGYVLLPFAPVQLPDGMGIRQVMDHDDNTRVLAPMEATANVVFSELDVNTMDDTPIYTLEQNNISTGAGEESHLLRLTKLPMLPDTVIASVDIMMIVPLDLLDDYSDLAMPNGMENDLIQQVIMLMSKKPMPDNNNDQVISR